MTVDCFLDTNILIYAYDVEAQDKHKKAKDIVYSFSTCITLFTVILS